MKSSAKTKLVEQVLIQACEGVINAKSWKDIDKELIETAENFCVVLKYRYLSRRILNVPKSKDWYLNILPQYDDFRFKNCLRVTRDQFTKIFSDLYKQSLVTDYNRQDHKISLELQLAVALYRFGNDGSGSSFRRVAHIFGISEGGTIRNSTDTIIKLLTSMEASVISWPDAAERVEICREMQSKLPGCIGYVDGSHINLFKAPIDDHESYYSRKQKYGLHIQAVCDNKLQIRHLMVGYPASAHDARVFANCNLSQEPDKFFSDGEWLAGDSAYRLSPQMVTPFRDNARCGTAVQRRNFNRHFSSYRVHIEQTFGVLKEKFCSLKQLRIQVDKTSGHRRACEWIIACAVLYNLLRKYGNPEMDDDWQATLEQKNDTNENLHEQFDDDSRRASLFQWFIQSK